MNLRMTNIEIKTVEGGSRIKGQDGARKYLRYELIDPINPQIGYPAQTSFRTNVVNAYAAVLPANRGGALPEDTAWTEDQLPMRMRNFSGAVNVTYDLGGKFCRLYTADILDQAGNVIPGKAQGDVVCNNAGIPKIYTSLTIICREKPKTVDVRDEYGEVVFGENGLAKVQPMKDENGNYIMEWMQDYSPDEVAESQRASLIPYEEAMKIKYGATPEEEEAEIAIEDLLEPAPAATA